VIALAVAHFVAAVACFTDWFAMFLPVINSVDQFNLSEFPPPIQALPEACETLKYP
jgi:hypothetical protein